MIALCASALIVLTVVFAAWGWQLASVLSFSLGLLGILWRDH